MINSLNKIICITGVNLRHVSALGCHPQEIFPIKGIQTQDANLGTPRSIAMIKILQL